MGCYHGKTGDGGDIWVCTGSGREFIARVHHRGAHEYKVVSRHRSEKAAIMSMAKAFAADRHNFLNRADVLFCADYYDPVQVCELRRS